MTLITVGAEARPSPHRPTPASTRFQPLRAGLLNLWEYDDQEFWFEGGRLILRGGNEAGKSKALEMLLPFLFDADLRPHRLDPFGEKAKTMHWNLVGFQEDRKSAIGYTWLEFGRLEADRPVFLTIGAGMRATLGSKRVQSWFFVTPQRMGEELVLTDGRIPLTKKLLAERLQEKGRVFEHATEYRGTVDRELFGLGEERYAALVHLLLRLRRPHLSSKLDPAALSALLRESLPPLDAGKVERLAEAFERLEDEARQIEELSASHRVLGSFLEGYTTYSRQRARVRAGQVRTAFTRLDGVTRRVREATRNKDEAEQRLRELADLRVKAEQEYARLGGVLRALEESDEMRAAGRLAQLRNQTGRDRGAAAEALERARELGADLTKAGEAAVRAEEKSRNAKREAESAAHRAVEKAKIAGMLERHEVHAEAFDSDPQQARRALDTAVASRLLEVKRLRDLEGLLAEAEAALSRARGRMQDAAEREERASEAVVAAKTLRDQVEGELGEAIASWVDALPIEVPESAAEEIFQEAVRRVAGEEPVRSLPEAIVRPGMETAEKSLAEHRDRLRDAEKRRDELVLERETVLLAREEGPPHRPGRSPDREALPGEALWKLCDFAAGVREEVKARVEAALEASGLLDARILPEGRLLDPDTLDFVIQGDAPATGRTLSDLLVPVPTGAVAEPAIRRALELVAVAPENGPEPEPESSAWIGLDGAWRIGPLQGRWSKENAEHVGAGAREQARRRRIAILDALIEEAAREIREHLASVDRMRQHVSDIRNALSRFPSVSALVQARTSLRERERISAEAQREKVEAERTFLASRERRDAAQGTLTREAARLGMADRLGALEDLREDIREYKSAVARLESESRFARSARQTAAERGDARREAERRKIGQDRRVEDALKTAEASRAEAEELQAREGKSVAEVLKRRDEARGRRDDVARSLKDNEDERAAAERCAGAAETALSASKTERGQREEERDGAVASLERLAQTEILTLALGDEKAGPSSLGLTAALELARRIEAVTSTEGILPVDLDRGDNLCNAGFGRLQTELTVEYRPERSRIDGLLVVTVQHLGSPHRAGALKARLEEEIAKRRTLLDKDEREVIEKHLLAELGHHLQERTAAGRRLVEEMNRELAEHRTNSGQRIRLVWSPAAETGDGVKQAVELLRKDVRLLSAQEKAALVRFLRERIQDGRDSEDAGSNAERVGRALDYRGWHEFKMYIDANGGSRQLSRKFHATGSGGSRALLVHLPLFAAAAAHYRSARAEAPHLVLLDEAFAGIDADQRGSLMGLLVAFDLDFMMTNHEEWGCYAELPSVATYHLRRHPGRPGVAAVRFVWNGTERKEDDPHLREKTGEFDW